MKGLAFIGMMGSGKTTISQKVAKDLALTYYSIDQEIEKDHKMTVSSIFSKHGENHFRESETNTIKQLVAKPNIVIDCGGGVVLNKENIQIMKDNGFKVIFLNREITDIISDIDFETRPLLKDNHEKIYNIYNERLHLYMEHADVIINNTGCLMTQYARILNEIKFSCTALTDVAI
ncbi:MAG: shikimate kinase [Clostridiales bacterium]|jgi:shikimate kinase|nr:shikimate kinase [Clostridiales bacterium]MDN5299687.1 shikimate kinase [Clostridiales bacterium]